jgi:hypothetical protein
MIIVHDVNPVDALRELKGALEALDFAAPQEVTKDHQDKAAWQQARLEVLRSIAGVSKVLRMGKFPEPKEGE